MSNNENIQEVAKVYVANGAGNTPIEVEYHDGDTVANILKRANIVIKQGQTPTLGKKRIKDANKTPVSAGDTIVIAGQPSNG